MKVKFDEQVRNASSKECFQTGNKHNLTSLVINQIVIYRYGINPIQSNMSMHHYECIALCFVNIVQ